MKKSNGCSPCLDSAQLVLTVCVVGTSLGIRSPSPVSTVTTPVAESLQTIEAETLCHQRARAGTSRRPRRSGTRVSPHESASWYFVRRRIAPSTQ